MVYPYNLNKCLQHVALFKCRDILVLFLFYISFTSICVTLRFHIGSKHCTFIRQNCRILYDYISIYDVYYVIF